MICAPYIIHRLLPRSCCLPSFVRHTWDIASILSIFSIIISSSSYSSTSVVSPSEKKASCQGLLLCNSVRSNHYFTVSISLRVDASCVHYLAMVSNWSFTEKSIIDNLNISANMHVMFTSTRTPKSTATNEHISKSTWKSLPYFRTADVFISDERWLLSA